MRALWLALVVAAISATASRTARALPNGASCTAGTQCDSTHCTDGVCCNSACTAQCEACDVTNFVGTCTPVQGTPHNSRVVCAAGTICDGARRTTCQTIGGACVKFVCADYPAGSCGQQSDGCGGLTTDCGPCANPNICGGGGFAKCGSGTCQAKSCAMLGANCGSMPNGCGSTNSCGNCIVPQTCGGGGIVNQCGTPPDAGTTGSDASSGKPAGASCLGNPECASGYCVDGVCCRDACNNQCLSCAEPGNAGTCMAVTTPRPPRPSCGAYQCGALACRTSCSIATAGSDCVAGASCVGGRCVDGDAAVGNCSGATCPQGICHNDRCVTAADLACTSNTECMQKFTMPSCYNGTCCFSSCSGPCQRCDIPGELGKCGLYTGPVPVASCPSGGCELGMCASVTKEDASNEDTSTTPDTAVDSTVTDSLVTDATTIATDDGTFARRDAPACYHAGRGAMAPWLFVALGLARRRRAA